MNAKPAVFERQWRRLAVTFISAVLALAAVMPASGQSSDIPRNLSILLASQPPQSGVISTKSADQLSLLVQSGSTISLAESSGRDYQVRAGGGLHWTQVQQVPANQESVVMTPTVQADGSVSVALDIVRKQGASLRQYSVTLVAVPGDWIQVLGASQRNGATSYSTRQVGGESLFLKVERF